STRPFTPAGCRNPRSTRASARSGCCAPPSNPNRAKPSGLQEPGKLLLEAREASAAVDQLLLAAGPGRMRFRVDIEMHRVARLAPRGAGLELGAVGHHHLDGVILGVDLGFHRLPRRFAAPSGGSCR